MKKTKKRKKSKNYQTIRMKTTFLKKTKMMRKVLLHKLKCHLQRMWNQSQKMKKTRVITGWTWRSQRHQQLMTK